MSRRRALPVPVYSTPSELGERIATRWTPAPVALATTLVLGIGVMAPSAIAASFTVNVFDATPGDGLGDAVGTCPASCTLRAAINAAQANGAALDTIKFTAVTTPRTITLTSDLPTITHPLTITGLAGPKRRLVTVDGDDNYSIFQINAAVEGSNVTITDLTLEDGNSYDGGCVGSFDADLLLSNVEITGCFASNNGGAVAVIGGTVKIVDSTIDYSQANYWGGGLYLSPAAPPPGQGVSAALAGLVQNCYIDNNRADFGGNIGLNPLGAVVIENSEISEGYDTLYGGGIAVYDTSGQGTVTIRGSTLNDNYAYYGGGLSVASLTGGRVNVDNSTIAYNTARYGGGIYARNANGLLRVRSSTVASNDAAQFYQNMFYYGGFGGNAYITGDAVLIQNSIFAANAGAADDDGDNFFGGTFQLHNSIVYGGNTNTTPAVFSGTAITAGFSVLAVGDLGGFTGTAATVGSPTDNGDADICKQINSNKDQRGVLRNVDFRGDGLKACDIGAYEFNGNVIACPDNFGAIAGTCSGDTVTFPKGSLAILDNAGHTTDSMTIKMTGGTTTTTSFFGQPQLLADGDANVVCVYDGTDDLVASLNVPSGHPVATGAYAWKLMSGGKTSFAFPGTSTSPGNADGVKTMTQAPSALPGSAAVNVSAAGLNFTPAEAATDTTFLDTSGAGVRVVNVISNGNCADVTFTAANVPAGGNVLGKFSASK